METAASTDVGRVRELNEDAVWSVAFAPDAPNPLRLGALLLVADGMGGHEAGEVASNMAAETARAVFCDGEFFKDELDGPPFLQRVGDAIKDINRVVFQKSSELAGASAAQPGTTLTLGLLRESEYFLGHVGDSRAYLFRGASAQIEQLTDDDSFVGEAMRRGHMTPEEARASPLRNQITKAIGLESEVKPSLYYGHWAAGDAILICSDGLTEHVSDDEIGAALSTQNSGGQSDLRAACANLILLANERGGHDNISIAAARNDAPSTPRADKTLEFSREDAAPLAASIAASSLESPTRNATQDEYSIEDSARAETPVALDEKMKEERAQFRARRAQRKRRDIAWMCGATGILGIILIGVTMGKHAATRSASTSRSHSHSHAAKVLAPRKAAIAVPPHAVPSKNSGGVEVRVRPQAATRHGAALVIESSDASFEVRAAEGDNGNAVFNDAPRAFVAFKSWPSFQRKIARGVARITLENARDDLAAPAEIHARLLPGREYSLLYSTDADADANSKPKILARVRVVKRAAATLQSGGRDAGR